MIRGTLDDNGRWSMKPVEGFVDVLSGEKIHFRPYDFPPKYPRSERDVLVIPRSLAIELEIYLSAFETDAEGKELLAKLKEREP
jgi:hypothetical protein